MQIWQFQQDRFVDVSRQFPEQIRRDARQWLKAYQQDRKGSPPDVRGGLAAYAADESLLGRPEVGWRLIEHALANGELAAPDDPTTAEKYVNRLKRFLAKEGYREPVIPQAAEQS